MKHWILFFVLLSIGVSGHAQAIPSSASESSDSSKEKKLDFVPVPYISYNRTTEFEYGLIPLFMYKLNREDTISPKSISGGLAVRTTNGTGFAFLFNRWYLKEDKYRLAFAAGYGNYNAQVFIDNIWIPSDFYDFSTEFGVLYTGIQRRVWRDLFLGIGMVYVNTESQIDPFEERVSDNERVGLSFTTSYDTRDDVYFPRDGSLFEARSSTFLKWFSNEEESTVLKGGFNEYLSIRQNKDVLAIRLSTDLAVGEVSFEQQVVVGGVEVRGYSQGKFRGEQVYNLQAEYRWMPLSHLGFVGFGSMSKLYGSTIDAHNEYWYPAIGGGVRYLVLKENNMRVGLDYGVGREDWGVYFKIGESF